MAAAITAKGRASASRISVECQMANTSPQAKMLKQIGLLGGHLANQPMTSLKWPIPINGMATTGSAVATAAFM